MSEFSNRKRKNLLPRGGLDMVIELATHFKLTLRFIPSLVTCHKPDGIILPHMGAHPCQHREGKGWLVFQHTPEIVRLGEGLGTRLVMRSIEQGTLSCQSHLR